MSKQHVKPKGLNWAVKLANSLSFSLTVALLSGGGITNLVSIALPITLLTFWRNGFALPSILAFIYLELTTYTLIRVWATPDQSFLISTLFALVPVVIASGVWRLSTIFTTWIQEKYCSRNLYTYTVSLFYLLMYFMVTVLMANIIKTSSSLLIFELILLILMLWFSAYITYKNKYLSRMKVIVLTTTLTIIVTIGIVNVCETFIVAEREAAEQERLYRNKLHELEKERRLRDECRDLKQKSPSIFKFRDDCSHLKN